MSNIPNDPLAMAKEKAGGPAKLAALLGVTPAAVSQWSQVPQHHVAAVSKLLRRSRAFVRPDIFGNGESASA
jgi:DNA-binding transcriptional regulator YdaS (Cro superfamily)